MACHYFAYGSNMSTPRLRARIPEARPLGVGRIDLHRLACNKRGRDGSGKANLVRAADAHAWGVVFELPEAAWPTLDRFEWGYARASARVALRRGGALDVGLYLAVAPEPRWVAPFDWYRDHCLRGAREHRLPREAIAAIARWPTRPAPR